MPDTTLTRWSSTSAVMAGVLFITAELVLLRSDGSLAALTLGERLSNSLFLAGSLALVVRSQPQTAHARFAAAV
jgi:hypothetical protein